MHDGVRPWEQEPFMAIVEPHKVRRPTALSPHLQNLPCAIGFTNMVGLQNQRFTNTGLHGAPPLPAQPSESRVIPTLHDQTGKR